MPLVKEAFLRSVAEFIDTHRLLAPAERVLVAVSGGSDSVALTLALRDLSTHPDRRYRLHLAHLDHALRGEESAEDARFVADLADRLGLPLLFERREVVSAGEVSIRCPSLEDAARRVRYRFLLESARRVGAPVVAVGHTRDDQMETVLYRLVRGASLVDLAGMPASRPLAAGADVRLVRPFLGVGRCEVLDFLAAHGFSHREDSSNLDLRFLRNRIRHELLPFLERNYGEGVRASILRLGELAREYGERLADVVEALLADPAVRITGTGAVSLPVRALASLPPGVLEVLLRRLVGGFLPEPAVSWETVERVRKLLRGGRGNGWVPLGGGLRARRLQDRLVVEWIPAQ